MTEEIQCDYCGYDGQGSHYHCGRCGGLSSMMGHYMQLKNIAKGELWKEDLIKRLGITIPWTGFTCDPHNEIEDWVKEG